MPTPRLPAYVLDEKVESVRRNELDREALRSRQRDTVIGAAIFMA